MPELLTIPYHDDDDDDDVDDDDDDDDDDDINISHQCVHIPNLSCNIAPSSFLRQSLPSDDVDSTSDDVDASMRFLSEVSESDQMFASQRFIKGATHQIRIITECPYDRPHCAA